MKYCQCNDNKFFEQRRHTFTGKLRVVYRIYLTEYWFLFFGPCIFKIEGRTDQQNAKINFSL